MDDLEQVAVLLAKPEPSGHVIDRGRDQLTEAIRAPARRRPARPHPAGRRPARLTPAGWLAAGATLTAATAAAVVVASGLVTPAGVNPAAARKILLAAAATALHQRPGTYWHVKIRTSPTVHVRLPLGTHVQDSFESWIALDGKFWNAPPRCAAPPGTAVFEGPGYAGYFLGNLEVTYQVTRHLPTSPAALTAWIAKYDRPGAGGGPTFVPDTLISLLWQVPAPPAVRAAAFEALAALPGVTSLGPVKGGQGFLITSPHMPAPTGWTRLVVDPRTALVRSEGNFKGIMTIRAGWTNRLPRVIPVPPKNACDT